VASPDSAVRLRLEASDDDYPDGRADPCRILSLFRALALRLVQVDNAHEGFVRRFEEIEITAPVYGGDLLEAEGTIVEETETDFVIEFVVRTSLDGVTIIVCQGRGTWVVPDFIQAPLSS
jgi:3-aminobutyryl-CoA ammonia-lyase